MKKRLLSVFLAMLTLLSLFPTAMAASSEDAALGEVNIYNGDYELGYLSINGAVRNRWRPYFTYESQSYPASVTGHISTSVRSRGPP